MDSSEDFPARYAEIAPAIHVWASLRLRSQLRAFGEVEDLLQEIWARAYAIRERFDPTRCAFRPWLFRVAKKVLLEVLRVARRAGRVQGGEGRTSRIFRLEAVADEVASITRRVALDDSLREFHCRIEELEDEERDLVPAVPQGNNARRDRRPELDRAAIAKPGSVTCVNARFSVASELGGTKCDIGRGLEVLAHLALEDLALRGARHGA